MSDPIMGELELLGKTIEEQAKAAERQVELNRRTIAVQEDHSGQLRNHKGRLDGHGKKIRLLVRLGQNQARTNTAVNERFEGVSARFTSIEDREMARDERITRLENMSVNLVRLLLGFVVGYILVWALATTKIDVDFIAWDAYNAIIALVALGFGMVVGSFGFSDNPASASQPAPQQQQDRPARSLHLPGHRRREERRARRQEQAQEPVNA